MPIWGAYWRSITISIRMIPLSTRRAIGRRHGRTYSALVQIFVADLGGMLASTCMLAVIIENVVTHPDHRCEGLGRSVLAFAFQAAWSVDCYKVMLATGSRKPETLRFYEAAGFIRGFKTFFEARRE